MNSNNKEIEVRFLDINKPALVGKLEALGAIDNGEELISEIAFYDKELTWMNKELKVLRLRKSKGAVQLAFKHHHAMVADGTKEIEVEVSDFDKTREILEIIGLVPYRQVEKKRHTFEFGEVTIDFDTWPTVPTLVELEGESEDSLKDVAQKLGLPWETAVFEPSIIYLRTRYNIPIEKVRVFTFSEIKIEP